MLKKNSPPRANRFKLPNDGTEFVENNWLDDKLGQYLIAPVDYENGFVLKTTIEDLIFYVKERVDRDIIMHEIYNVCKQVSTEIELMSAR